MQRFVGHVVTLAASQPTRVARGRNWSAQATAINCVFPFGNTNSLDYPEAQRSELLDLLFLPQYGASVQMLKVELGGDDQSTDGTEPSHSHVPGDTGCNRGWEWWLLEEARRRNPAIRTYALPWGFFLSTWTRTVAAAAASRT